MGDYNRFNDIPGIGGTHVICYAVHPNTGATTRLKHKESLNTNEVAQELDLPEQGSMEIEYLQQGVSYNWNGNLRLVDLYQLAAWGRIANSGGNSFSVKNCFPLHFIQEHCDPEEDEDALKAGTAKVITSEFIRGAKVGNKGTTNSTGGATTVALSGRCLSVDTVAGKISIQTGSTSTTAVPSAASQFSSGTNSEGCWLVSYEGSDGDFIDMTKRKATDGTADDPSWQFKAYDAVDNIGGKGCVVFYGLPTSTAVIIATNVQSDA